MVSGVVSLCETGPVEGAFVYIPGYPFGAVTDAGGAYRFFWVPQPGGGALDLAVSATGLPLKKLPGAVAFQSTTMVIDVVLTNTTNDNNNCGACGNVCNAGTVCVNSACEAPPLLNLGAACLSSNQCQSGNCVDGVCANTSCSGVCQAANLAGSVGVCSFVPNGQDPANECPGSSVCNGSGACTVTCPAGSQMCGGQCVDLATNTNNCGACGQACGAGNVCVSGMCVVPLQPVGSACTQANQCLSGHCVDGFCANTACSGSCVAAAFAKTGVANGTCAPIVGGTDPDNECATQNAATCGTNGFCNGSGACQLYAAGTVCGAATCVGNVANGVDTCNGAGSCIQGLTTNCNPFACNTAGDACRTSCTANSDCAVGNVCSGGMCVAALANGAACVSGANCQSGFCVDGVCSNTACAATCQAASAVKKGFGADGACGNIAAGLDPDNECPGTSTCNGAGACTANDLSFSALAAAPAPAPPAIKQD